jgi:hypothetical protein
MRTQFHLSLVDVPDDLPDCDGACFRPGGGLCCPDDPLDLVLQLFPNAAPAAAPGPHEVSLTALGRGGSPRRQDQPPPFGWAQENGFGDVTVERDSYGLSSRVPEHVEPIDVDKYLVDGGEVTMCNSSRDAGAMPAGGVRACGALGGVVSDYAPPPLAPMSAGALHQYACRAFDGVVSNGAPPLPAPMPANGGLHACGAPRGAMSNDAPPIPAGALHACRALARVVPDDAPPSAWSLPAYRISSNASGMSSGSLTSTTSESSSPAAVWQPLAWPVLKKRRRPPVKCRKRPWSLDFPLHAVPVAPPDNPSDSNRNGDVRNSCDNAAAGGIRRRRRPVPRQRNMQAQRVCSHCHSRDTPQWRAGPDGPGTLCNACGICYAAGKLLPEYRPSTAPSFRSDQHSNRHRKVVKLREQKEKETLKAMPDPVLVSPKSNDFMDVCTYMSSGL